MKETEVMAAANRVPVMVGEYYAAKVNSGSRRDEETGKSEDWASVGHTILFADQSIVVSQRLDSPAAAAVFVSPFKRGDRVVVLVEMLKREKGVTKIYGKLESISKN